MTHEPAQPEWHGLKLTKADNTPRARPEDPGPDRVEGDPVSDTPQTGFPMLILAGPGLIALYGLAIAPQELEPVAAAFLVVVCVLIAGASFGLIALRHRETVIRQIAGLMLAVMLILVGQAVLFHLG